MIAGHYATALAAERRVPTGRIAYYLAASQLPDLAWFALDLFGLAPVHTHAASSLAISMTHDVVPAVIWVAVALLVGRVLLRSWAIGGMGALLVALHVVADLVAGYPHNLMGPGTLEVGTGLYYVAPYLAVALEGLFAAAFVGWVALRDRRDGVRRSVATWAVRAFLFVGGIGASFALAPQLAALEPNGALDLVWSVGLLATYGLQIALLAWGESRPVSLRADAVDPAVPLRRR